MILYLSRNVSSRYTWHCSLRVLTVRRHSWLVEGSCGAGRPMCCGLCPGWFGSPSAGLTAIQRRIIEPTLLLRPASSKHGVPSSIIQLHTSSTTFVVKELQSKCPPNHSLRAVVLIRNFGRIEAFDGIVTGGSGSFLDIFKSCAGQCGLLDFEILYIHSIPPKTEIDLVAIE